MKAHDVFPSKWLAAADLNGKQPVVTIDHVDWATFTDGTKKRAVYFVGKEKALTLNATNFNMIVEITGEDDDDNWAGHKVRLLSARVDFKGKMVDALRVDYPPAEPAPARSTGKPKPRPMPVSEADDDIDAAMPDMPADDDIGF